MHTSHKLWNEAFRLAK